LKEFVDAFVGTRFAPAGKVEGHSRVLYARSYFDCVFRILGFEHLEGFEHLATPVALEEESLVVAGDEPH